MTARNITSRRLAAALAGLLLVGSACSTGDDTGSGSTGTTSAFGDTGGCTVVDMSVSSEKIDLINALATSFNKEDHKAGGTCIFVRPQSKASGGAAAALSGTWDTDVDGPKPVIWSPASTAWGAVLNQRLDDQGKAAMAPADSTPFMLTPLVIAMPKPMATALGYPDKPVGWADLARLATDPAGWSAYGHPEWGQFRLGKTNPNYSTSGLSALIAQTYAAANKTSGLGTEDLANPTVVDFSKKIESSVVHYGDISITFLENLRRADEAGDGLRYVSAIAIEEKSVWDYNQGNPSGDPATLGQEAPPSTPLVAVYPKEGTLVNDHPYAILDAPWVSPAQHGVAEDFLHFVQEPDQQARFQAAGFRDYQGRPGAQISQANGLLADEPKLELSTPSAPVLDAIQRSWTDLRKRARVLLVLDVSGSMGDSAGSSGASKLELAKSAAIQALGEFAKDDEVGLWIFSSDQGPGGVPYEEVSPVSALGPKRTSLEHAIAALKQEGATGLYATVDDATSEMSTAFDPDRINGVVVLTDGRNDYAAFPSIDPLLTQLTHQPAARSIRVFCIAYGEDAEMEPLQQIADTSLGAAYDASDPATIDEVFAAVISNF